MLLSISNCRVPKSEGEAKQMLGKEFRWESPKLGSSTDMWVGEPDLVSQVGFLNILPRGGEPDLVPQVGFLDWHVGRGTPS